MSARNGGPIRHISAGVVWAHGTPAPAPWAVFEIDPAGYLLAGVTARRETRQTIEQLCRNVSHALVLGVASPIPERRLAMRQRAGGSSHVYDAWAAGAQVGEWWERSYWVCVRLGLTESTTQWARRWASDRWKARHGVAVGLPSQDEERKATSEAQSARSRLTALRVRSATAAEIEWLCARRYEPALPRPVGFEERDGRARVSLWADTVIPTDPGRRVAWVRRPSGPPSACATLVCSASPNVAFDDDPGESVDAGLVCRAEAAAAPSWPVDWSMRVWRDQRDDKLRTWRARNLAHQVASGEEADAAGADPSDEQASAEIADLRDRLAERAGPELRAVTTFTVWDTNVDVVDERCDAVQAAVGAWELVRPPKDQDRLLDAQVPGSSAPVGVADWADHLLPSGVAAAGMFAGGERVGNERGLLLGYLTGSTLGEPFVWDPAAAAKKGDDHDANLVVLGSPGKGKSSFTKTLSLALTARGDRALVIDPSPHGEWRTVAAAASRLGWSAQVVHADEGAVTLDPLQVLPPGERVDAAVAALATLAKADAGSPESAVIRERVEKVAGIGGRLIDVVDGLEHDIKDPVAFNVGRVLAGLAKHRHASALFSRHAKPVSPDAGLVVVAMNNLRLVQHEQRAVTEEQIIGQAVVAAAMGYAQHWAFGRPEFTMLVFEEFGVLQSSPWIIEQAARIGRQARKHNAMVAAILQFPSDVHPTIASLCRYVAAFGVPDKTNEKAAGAVLLGRDGDEDIMSMLPSLINGRMLFRSELTGRVGSVQCALPPHPELVKAVSTSVGDNVVRLGDAAA